MSPIVRRCTTTLALLVTTLGAALGLAGPASADVVQIPGCYGVGIVLCDITVSVDTPAEITGFTTIDVPVCVQTCQTLHVPVPTLATNLNGSICVTANDLSGQRNLDECIPYGFEVVVGPCLSGVGYAITIGGVRALGCNVGAGTPVPTICIGTGNVGVYEPVTTIRFGSC